MLYKIAIFCTADDNYVDYAIIALKSFTRFHNFDPFVISRPLKKGSKKKLSEHGIGFIETEDHLCVKSDRWPSETFLMLWGPEALNKMGYKFSVGIDADILCLKPLVIHEIFPCETYAGCRVNNPTWLYQAKCVLLNQKEWFDLSGVRPQAGILFWNNIWATKYHLWAKSLESFFAWGADNFKCADQSLLASLNIPFKILPDTYNSRVIIKTRPVTIDINNIQVIHFVGVDKPWNKDMKYKWVWDSVKRELGL